MFSSYKIDKAERDQIFDGATCIPYNTKALAEGVNLIIH